MKTIKSYIVGLAAMGALTFTGCNMDVDPVPVNIPEATLTPNTTLLELKTKFWDDATNYIKTIDTKEDGEHYIIHGRVISSDEEGNVFKSLVIQDETCALAFSINSYDLYVNYRVGQEIVVDATGMQIGKYNGLQQMGKAEWYENGQTWEASFMPLEVFREHIELNGLPEPSKIDTIQVNTFSELPSTPEGLCKYQSQLVRFNNIKFQEGGKEKFSVYQSSGESRLIEDVEGNTLTVRTSGYCDFWNKTLPEGNGDLVCILGYYGTTGWQLTIIDYAGCMNFGNPTLAPGTKDNPFTVEAAIANEANGKNSTGWVTGYIVGTVAPEVTTISSSSDIEWTAEASLANTLVIGPTPDCTDVAQCLVMALPQDSKLRQYAALRDNPDVYKRQIWVYGALNTFMGTWGITDNKGSADQFTIEGVTVDGDTSAPGDGSKEMPYNVNQVQAGSATGTVWVTGYIVGTVTDKSISTSTEFGTANANPANILIAMTPDCTDYTKCVPVQLTSGSAPRAALNLKDHPDNLQKVVKVYGSIEAYFGVTGVKSVTDYVLDGNGGTETPVDPTPQDVIFSALSDDLQEMPADWTIENVTLGSLSYVWTWKVYNNKGYLNGSGYLKEAIAAEAYAISPEIDLAGTTAPALSFDHAAKFQTTLKDLCGVYARKAGTTAWTKLTIPTWPTAGAWDFVNSGSVDLSAFAGEKIQVAFKYGSSTAGADTWEIKNLQVTATGGGNGGSTGGGTTDPGTGGGEDPVTPPAEDGETTSILATELTTVPGSTTIDGYTIDIQKSTGGTNPALHATTSAIRLYAKNTMEVSSSTNISKIVFTLSDDNKFRYTTLTPSTGTITPAQAEGDATVTWVGNAKSVTFTVGEKATMGSDGADKAGQVRFTKLDITAAK